MIPKILHQVWLGPNPPNQGLQKMMESVREKNPDWRYLLWTETTMENLGLNWALVRSRCQGIAASADFVRLWAIQTFGGIYLDVDVECLHSLDGLVQYSAFAAPQADGLLCNAFFGAEAGHPWVKWQFEHLPIPLVPPQAVFLMTKAPRERLTVIASHLCYPYSWDTPPAQCLPHPQSIVVHRWEKNWGSTYRKALPMKRQFHFGCSINVLPPPWENFDLDPHLRVNHPEIKVLDVTHPLPFSDACAERVFFEHLLEHLTAPDGYRLLKECHRVLAPGGVLRICVPELERLPRAWREDIITKYGHLMVYHYEILSQMLVTAGFERIHQEGRAECDGHWKVIGRERDDQETLRVEAYKPYELPTLL